MENVGQMVPFSCPPLFLLERILMTREYAIEILEARIQSLKESQEMRKAKGLSQSEALAEFQEALEKAVRLMQTAVSFDKEVCHDKT